MQVIRPATLALLVACFGLAMSFLLPARPVPMAAPKALSLQRVGGFSGARSSSSGTPLFATPPRPTRANEPDDYFKTNLDKKPIAERILDPQVLIGLVGILLPFIAVGALFAGGFLTR